LGRTSGTVTVIIKKCSLKISPWEGLVELLLWLLKNVLLKILALRCYIICPWEQDRASQLSVRVSMDTRSLRCSWRFSILKILVGEDLPDIDNPPSPSLLDNETLIDLEPKLAKWPMRRFSWTQKYSSTLRNS
jgi:hypothetical protein